MSCRACASARRTSARSQPQRGHAGPSDRRARQLGQRSMLTIPGSRAGRPDCSAPPAAAHPRRPGRPYRLDPVHQVVGILRVGPLQQALGLLHQGVRPRAGGGRPGCSHPRRTGARSSAPISACTRLRAASSSSCSKRAVALSMVMCASSPVRFSRSRHLQDAVHVQGKGEDDWIAGRDVAQALDQEGADLDVVERVRVLALVDLAR